MTVMKAKPTFQTQQVAVKEIGISAIKEINTMMEAMVNGECDFRVGVCGHDGIEFGYFDFKVTVNEGKVFWQGSADFKITVG